ncbi:MAG: 2-amino-4-hydroxy-6-hydroxymethyldihydropteridine diphosphokinase [Deltaproteobacteria bacterium]|nr:2-amino-4-hydroxy-6-hydroxymethyldihydropteridine diphosphokinase [Deltaproteobacteria bacterium]
MRVFISIGSNLGDRVRNCREAVRRVAANGGIRLVKESSLYETEPWGVVDQGPFINSVIEIETQTGPRELFEFLKKVESAMGRTQNERWGPRAIDLDIIFYGDLSIDEEGLTVPHQSMRERAFVLVPLNEIAPDLIHPVLGKTVSELLRDLPGKGGVQRLTEKI